MMPLAAKLTWKGECVCVDKSHSVWVYWTYRNTSVFDYRVLFQTALGVLHKAFGMYYYSEPYKIIIIVGQE